MIDNELKQRLGSAKSLEEVQSIVQDYPGLDAKRLWEEAEHHHFGKAEKLDLDELDAVSGGAHRDWVQDGCAATCEEGSWCWSNDKCEFWDVTYSNFWTRCPDGHPHEYDSSHVCVRCGHLSPYGDWHDN